MHFYPHHIGDFLKDTSSLTPEESYYYLRLIWLYYDTEQPLPDDIPSLAFKIGARGKEDCVRSLIAIYFTFDSDLKSHTHQRIDAEIRKYQSKSASAKRANQIRWESERDLKSDLKSDAKQIPTKNQEPINKKLTPQVADLFPGVDPDVLEEFMFLRKKLRAPITRLAADGIKREASKAGISLTEALTMCCERSWRSFKADWVGRDTRTQSFDFDSELRGAI